MKNGVIVAAALLAPCAICYYAGVFITAFDTNLCYSGALSTLAARAQTVAASGDRSAMQSFAAMLSALPLLGYESDCKKILAAVEAGTAGPGAAPAAVPAQPPRPSYRLIVRARRPAASA